MAFFAFSSFAFFSPIPNEISFHGAQSAPGHPANLCRLPEPSDPPRAPRLPLHEPPGYSCSTHTSRGTTYLVGVHPHLFQGRLEKFRRRFPHHFGFDATGILGMKKTQHVFGKKHPVKTQAQVKASLWGCAHGHKSPRGTTWAEGRVSQARASLWCPGPPGMLREPFTRRPAICSNA